MKIIFLTGSHPRHAEMARAIASTGGLAGLVIEEREEHVPAAPDGLPEATARLFDHHFAMRSAAEKAFFDNPTLPKTLVKQVSHSSLNSGEVREFIRRINPDLLLSYGVHMLSDETLAAAEGEKWNIHGGLSPWYRGAITHFWPSYMLEPQMTGMTIHDLTAQLDHGDMVHQKTAELIRGDGLHDLACRAVQGLADEIPALMERFAREGSLQKKTHRTSGRLWLGRDWRPTHLHLIYDYYNDAIVDRYLNGDFGGSAPNLWRQLP